MTQACAVVKGSWRGGIQACHGSDGLPGLGLGHGNSCVWMLAAGVGGPAGPPSGRSRVKDRYFGQSRTEGCCRCQTRTGTPGHNRSVAPRAQSWPRRSAERQVSGYESGPVFGLTRPVALADQ